MGSSAVSIVIQVLSSAYSVFSDLLDGTGLGNVYISVFLIFLVVRFILAPIVGSRTSGVSDSARKRKDEEV